MNAIAIDDEPVALDIIKSMATKLSFIKISAYFTNAFEALSYLQQEKVDLIFLDIKMPDISGIELIKAIAQPPMVIFTTGYSEHAVQSFELDAIDYLLKPFSQARFLKASAKAFEQFKFRQANLPATGDGQIFIKSGTEKIHVELDEILYVESYGNYMQFTLSNRKITSRLTMADAEALLPKSQFIRIHRSYLVAKNHISKIDKSSVWIKQTELPIGAAYVAEINRLVK